MLTRLLFGHGPIRWREGTRRIELLFEQAIREAEKRWQSTRAACGHSSLPLLAGSALFLRMAADREHAIREAQWAAARAIELDGTDALGYALRGTGAILGGQLDRYSEALADARRAHEMNPNDTFVLTNCCRLEAGMGEPERAIEHLHQVLRLNPRDPRSHDTYNVLAFASFIAKQYQKALIGRRVQSVIGPRWFRHTLTSRYVSSVSERSTRPSNVRGVAKSGVRGMGQK